MTRITKRGINNKLEGLILGSLLKEFKNIKTKEDLTKILSKFLTTDEQMMIKKRLAISFLLQEGRKPKRIQEALDVSRTTISFVRRGLKNLSPKEKKYRRITAGDLRKPKYSKFPTYKGRGRWRFLDVY